MTFTFGRICDNILSTACNIMSLQSTRQPNSLNGSPSPWMGWMTMICSLSASNVTLLILPHLCTVVRQESIFWWHSAFGFFLSKFWKTFKSSANIDGVPPELEAGRTMSAKKLFQRGGPRTVPWKTWSAMVISSDTVPSTTTTAFHGCKYDDKKFRNCVPTPALWSFANI